MVRQYPAGVAIRVRAQGDGRPILFVLDGQTHRVASVEDVREPRLDWWSPTGEVHRVYWLVVTDRGLVAEIYRDVATGAWFLGRRFD